MSSIRTRLLLWLMIPLAVIAAIVSAETFIAARAISNDLNDRTLLAATLAISEHVISSEGTLLASDTLDRLTDNLGNRFFYHVTGPDGAFVTGYSHYPRPPAGLDAGLGAPLFFNSEHQGIPVRVVRLRQDLSGRALTGLTTITTWQHITRRADLTLNLFIRSLARLVMLVMAAGAIVWFAVSAGLRPLTSLQAAIDQRTPHDLNPIRRAMPIELKGIVGSMNKLFERVALSKKNRERFIGDAAHQLRNPIAAIKTQAETALETNSLGAVKAGLTQILGVANHSAAMINKMLSGASAYALELEQQGVSNLVAMVKQTTSDLAKDAFDNNQEISFSKREDHIPFRGNLVLLGEAVRNLISNAIMHNPAGTVIEVGIEAGIETSIKTGIEAGASGSPDHIEIYVADTGKAFDGERFALLTQPFMTGSFTTGHHHSGSGLGLSIAKDIAKAHGGELIYKPLPEGGKRIAIILPKLQA